jgi:hypothetical protein
LGFAAAGAYDDGPILLFAGLRWPLLVIFVVCLATEAVKFFESVLGFTTRRNM